MMDREITRHQRSSDHPSQVASSVPTIVSYGLWVSSHSIRSLHHSYPNFSLSLSRLKVSLPESQRYTTSTTHAHHAERPDIYALPANAGQGESFPRRPGPVSFLIMVCLLLSDSSSPVMRIIGECDGRAEYELGGVGRRLILVARVGWVHRCMAIIDFQKEAKQIGYRIEDAVEKDLFKEILKLVLDDSNTEVKNMAAQWQVTE